MNPKILVVVIAIFILQMPASSQSTIGKVMAGPVRDSTKMPPTLSDFKFFKTTPDDNEFLEMNFTTNERSGEIHIPYSLDSIHLFSDQNFISLIAVRKDTMCNDNSYMNFCIWKFTFPINSKQRHFLENTEVDKVSFWNKRIVDKVYLVELDKKIFQNKIKNF
ncbi:MAG: hypothetical protein ACXWV9_01425 [Flavisolibacter sp.]